MNTSLVRPGASGRIQQVHNLCAVLWEQQQKEADGLQGTAGPWARVPSALCLIYLPISLCLRDFEADEPTVLSSRMVLMTQT